MSFEETIRQIVREENQKHLNDIGQLLDAHGYHEVPRFLKVEEAAKILRIGRNRAYQLCDQSNGIPCIRDGNKIRIPYTALMNWIEQQANKAI